MSVEVQHDPYDFLRIYWTRLNNDKLSVNGRLMTKMEQDDGSMEYSSDDLSTINYGLAEI